MGFKYLTVLLLLCPSLSEFLFLPSVWVSILIFCLCLSLTNSVTRWPDYFSVLCHLQKWKFTPPQKKNNNFQRLKSLPNNYLLNIQLFVKQLLNLQMFAKVAKFRQIWSHCTQTFYPFHPFYFFAFVGWSENGFCCCCCCCC